MKSINIEPKEIVTIKHATRIDINAGQIRLNIGAIFDVWMYDSDGDLISVQTVSITGDEYAAWSNDDEYVYSIIMQKLGLIEKPDPEPDTPTGDSGTSGVDGQ